jgi:hypothetical protein
MTNRALLAVTLVVAVAGCTGGQKQSTAAATASGEVATPGSIANLPQYPGAEKMSTQLTRAVTYCGYKMNMTMYQVPGAGASTVADWYAGKIGNPIRINANVQASNGSGGRTNIELLDPGGGYGVVVGQMHLSGQLAAAAKKAGLDKTTIGTITYDPPISSGDMQMLVQAAGGDKAAVGRMKAKCGNGTAPTR